MNQTYLPAKPSTTRDLLSSQKLEAGVVRDRRRHVLLASGLALMETSTSSILPPLLTLQ